MDSIQVALPLPDPFPVPGSPAGAGQPLPPDPPEAQMEPLAPPAATHHLPRTAVALLPQGTVTLQPLTLTQQNSEPQSTHQVLPPATSAAHPASVTPRQVAHGVQCLSRV
ncbi:hypothetical protein GWK47_036315 [Chionoecetes opilio]|uniref:Uncharacterized protein n=1 Tax=Chionoecetes opilio TaxID=41210 RepID=A0A8J5CZR1_CHIOP|nr:hypothetical protein GWK47_036315 [Chionoecetes opilio]